MPYNGSARSEANLIKGVLPFLFIACSGAVLADTCLQSPDAFRSWVNKGEPYSVAVCDGSDPQKLFQEANAALLQATTNYRLRSWTAAVREGETPDFGANLLF
jgi:hypothetical protein